MRTSCACALALSLIATAAVLAAGQASSKSTPIAAAKHPWASFNPGSWVKIKSSSVNKSAGAQAPNVSETKITLLEKTADKVVLETELTMMGQVTKTKADLPLKGYTDAIPPGVTVLKRGTDTVVIGGKSLTCETLETEMDAGGTKIASKTWTSRQVPGSLVKSVTTMKSSQSTAEVIDFKGL